jgi:SAM-dependent methyltransferase
MKDSKKRGEEDVLGLMFWDYLCHKETLGITERNDGFIEAEDPQIWFSKYEKWLDVERKAIECVKGRSVLDIGCGTGRHALYLQNEKKGFDVLGIDTSPLAIKICKLHGLDKAKVQSIKQFTLNAIRRNYSFDTILMLGNKFGISESFKRARWLLHKFHEMTSDDA